MITDLYWAQPTSPPVNTRYGSENSSLTRSGSLRRITILSKGFKEKRLSPLENRISARTIKPPKPFQTLWLCRNPARALNPSCAVPPFKPLRNYIVLVAGRAFDDESHQDRVPDRRSL